MGNIRRTLIEYAGELRPGPHVRRVNGDEWRRAVELLLARADERRAVKVCRVIKIRTFREQFVTMTPVTHRCEGRYKCRTFQRIFKQYFTVNQGLFPKKNNSGNAKLERRRRGLGRGLCPLPRKIFRYWILNRRILVQTESLLSWIPS